MERADLRGFRWEKPDCAIWGCNREHEPGVQRTRGKAPEFNLKKRVSAGYPSPAARVGLQSHDR